MNTLSERQHKVHLSAKNFARVYTKAERDLVEVLIEVETLKIHKALGHSSMFKYVTKELNLSDPVALMLIGVARGARNFPSLRRAIAEEKLTPSKASRIVAHLNKNSVHEVVEFAINHSYRQIDHEMARRNPKLAIRDSAKPISEDLMQINVKISKAGYAKLQRVQSLLAQKGHSYEMGDAIEAALDLFLYKHDPIEKAKHSKPTELCAHRVRPTQAQKNAVLARDGGRCTFTDKNGERCDCDRWLDVHHIVLISEGGSNEMENMTTLCWFHHDLVHQMSFAIAEGG